jgi:hypothetical protein
VFFVHEKRNLTLSYNVSSYPAAVIEWWRSKNGVNYELITRCLASSQTCETHEVTDINITRVKFEIKDLRFSDLGSQVYSFYKLNATKLKENDSKIFQIQVLGKPDDSTHTQCSYKMCCQNIITSFANIFSET